MIICVLITLYLPVLPAARFNIGTKTGESRENAAMISSTQEIGLVKKIEKLPSEIASDFDRFVSIFVPRISPRITGGIAKSSFSSTNPVIPAIIIK